MTEYRQALANGSTLAGDYRIVGVLGQGGFGLTYKADDLRLGAPVAIKEYFPFELALREAGSTVVPRSASEQGLLEWGRAKFLEEARTLARFRHPSIVRVARLFEANNTAYMVLDFEEGPNLAEWRARLGRQPTQSEVDRIAERLLGAVSEVHRAGILHRDIKPSNVIMRSGVDPVLIDFGAARQALSAQSRTVHAIVTPGYSPKEQYAVDLDKQGPWSDIYALGATLYFLVAGRTPPDALSRDLGEQMLDPASPADKAAWRPEFLAAIASAMSLRAEDRPGSIEEWQPELLAGAATTSIASPTTPARTGRPAPPPASRPSSAAASARRPLAFEEVPSTPPPPSRERRAARASVLVIGAALVAISSMAGLGYWVGVAAPARDAAAWARATAADSIDAYDGYVREQPSGQHVAQARDRRNALESRRQSQGVSLAAQTTPPAPTRIEPAASPPSTTTVAPPTGAPSEQPPPIAPETRPTPPSPIREAATTPSPVTTSPPVASQPTAPAPPPVARVPERRTLPSALSDADVARLASAAPSARWRLAVRAFVNDRVRGFTEQSDDFIAELARLSGNRIETTVDPSFAGISNSEAAQRLRAEHDVLGWTTPIGRASQHLEYALFAGAVPFGLEPADHVRWLRGDGARLLEASYAEHGTPVRVIPCGIAGGVGAWFRREIRTPQELVGLKVRGGQILSRSLLKLNAQIATLPSNRDLAAAFAANQIDANFGVTPLSGIFLNKRVATVYQYPGIHNPSYLFELMIAPETWAAMVEPQRRLVDEACRRNLDRWVTTFPITQQEIIGRIRAQRLAIKPLTTAVQDAIRGAVGQVLSEEAAKNARFKEVLDSYNRYRR